MNGEIPDRLPARVDGGEAASPILDQHLDNDSLYATRAAVEAHATESGMPQGRAEDMVLAIHELATNTIRHGAGTGRLRIWRTGDSLVCRVDDQGPSRRDGEPPEPDAAASNRADGWPVQSGRGLWLIRHMADRMELRSGPDGTRADVTFDLPAEGQTSWRLAEHRTDHGTVLEMVGYLGRHSIQDLMDAVTSLRVGGGSHQVVLDWAGVTFWDATGLTGVGAVQKRLTEVAPSARLVLAAVPDQMLERLDSTGVLEELTVVGTAEQGVRADGDAF